MIFDLIIRNGQIAAGENIVHGNLGIQNGKIAALIEDNCYVEARHEIDCAGKYVLPGLIDINIHMRVPGQAHKEDFLTGTSAAAAGGVTTILDMPNTNPPTTTIERFKEKQALVKGNSKVDYAFNFGGAKDNLDELKNLENVPSVKFFMAGHETTPTTVTDLGILLKAFEILAEKDIPAMIHAENQAMINVLVERYKHRADFKAYSDARNDAVCETAVCEIICLAKQTGCRVHICHVSSEKEIIAIQCAKSDGVNITCEAVPYHLFLTYEDCERLGSLSKVSPALKSPKDQEALWNAVFDGTIDCITSEHTPHTLEEKNNSVWSAPAGMPGVQEMLPLLLNKGMPVNLISRLCAQHPAKIFGLSNKGIIRIGGDADIVIVDPEKKWRVNKKDLFSKCKWSAYEGLELKGVPIITIVRGNIVYKNGEISQENCGRYILIKR